MAGHGAGQYRHASIAARRSTALGALEAARQLQEIYSSFFLDTEAVNEPQADIGFLKTNNKLLAGI